MIDSQIKQRLSELNRNYVPFVTSSFAIDVATTIGKTEGFSEEQIAIFSNGISLFLLLYLNPEELASFIETECEVDPKKARDMSGFVLSSLPDGLLSLIDKAREELNASKTI